MTSSTLISLLLLALTAAISPFSLVAFSLVLATDRGPRNGIAFICGWVTTVMLIGVVSAVVGANVDVDSSNTAGTWTLALELALGVVLVLAWVRRRFRPRAKVESVETEATSTPAWQRHIATMRSPGAFVTGGAVQTWPVMIAAAATILRLGLGAAANLEWMLAFTLVTITGIVVLEVLAWRSPKSAAARLDRLNGFIHTHRDSVVNWLFLVAGLWLSFSALFVLF